MAAMLVISICPEGGQRWICEVMDSVHAGLPPQCHGAVMPKLRTTVDVIAEFRAVHGDRYGYASTQYPGAAVKVKVI